MLFGCFPFTGDNIEMYKKILKCDYDFPSEISQKSKDAIKGLINPDPEKRWTIDAIKKKLFSNNVTKQEIIHKQSNKAKTTSVKKK